MEIFLLSPTILVRSYWMLLQGRVQHARTDGRGLFSPPSTFCAGPVRGVCDDTSRVTARRDGWGIVQAAQKELVASGVSRECGGWWWWAGSFNGPYRSKTLTPQRSLTLSLWGIPSAPVIGAGRPQRGLQTYSVVYQHLQGDDGIYRGFDVL